MKLRLIKKEQEVAGVYSFYFQPEQELIWKAGQFLRYTLPDEKTDNRGINRFFTIASAPVEKIVRVTTRIAQKKGSSFKNKFNQLEIGAEIEANGPSGEFIIEELDKEYLFIAGGIGITPFRSIIKELSTQGKLPRIELLYANRDTNIVYKAELDEIASNNPQLKIIYIIDPNKIDAITIKEHIANIDRKMIYISGPEPMVEGIEQILQPLGVDKENIKTDYFPGYTS